MSLRTLQTPVVIYRRRRTHVLVAVNLLIQGFGKQTCYLKTMHTSDRTTIRACRNSQASSLTTAILSRSTLRRKTMVGQERELQGHLVEEEIVATMTRTHQTTEKVATMAEEARRGDPREDLRDHPRQRHPRHPRLAAEGDLLCLPGLIYSGSVVEDTETMVREPPLRTCINPLQLDKGQTYSLRLGPLLSM